jgi:small subunit ribosomal protein S3
MEERKFIRLKKEEYGIKESIKRNLGKGKISRLDIEYTPIGEKIIISTSRPGLIIGRKGEKIEELTDILKTRFKLENPHIEIKEIETPLYDAQLVADELAMSLERMGNLKFKVIAYRKLQEIMNAGALGCELRISGKLPSERAKSWRFAEGYLKKAGESRKEVDRAQAIALTKTGIIGIKVAIMSPKAKIYDRIDITEELMARVRGNSGNLKEIEASKNIDFPSKENKSKKSKNIDKVIKEVTETKEKKDSKKKKESAKILKKGEVKVIEEIDNSKSSSKSDKQVFAESKNLDIKPQEDGTAMKIEEEIEEGVPQEQINKDIQRLESKRLNKKKESK